MLHVRHFILKLKDFLLHVRHFILKLKDFVLQVRHFILKFKKPYATCPSLYSEM